MKGNGVTERRQRRPRRWGGGWLPPLLLAVVLAGCGGGGTTPGGAKARVSDDPELRMALYKGKAYLERGNYQMALPSLLTALKKDPDNPELLAALGLAYDQLGRPVQSLEMLQKAHAHQPDDGELNNNLGVALMRLERYQEAEEAFHHALGDQTFATPEQIHFNLAALYGQQQRIREMEQELNTALDINPLFFPARIELANHFGRLHRFDREQHHLRGALALQPDNGALLERLAHSYLNGGQTAQARALFTRLLELNPESEMGRRARERLNALGDAPR